MVLLQTNNESLFSELKIKKLGKPTCLTDKASGKPYPGFEKPAFVARHVLNGF